MNSQEFLTAAEYAKKLAQTPSHDELSELYGLYKQATVGDINIAKPGFVYFREVKKWEAWNKYKGTDKFSAEVQYVQAVSKMIDKYGVVA